MTQFDMLADSLRVSGRTLRRAAGRGTIRCVRESERSIRLSAEEGLYLRRHWPLLGRILTELRTLPNVRLAVLFGSTARGTEDDRSDLDVLVRFRQPGLAAHARLVERLEQASGRPVQLVELDGASPLLLVDVLRDGRVLVDRDGDWQRLRKNERRIRREAEAAEAALGAELSDIFADLLDGPDR